MRLLVLGFVAALAIAQTAGDWPSFGRDPGAARFSPLKQIHAGNVDRLQRAWTFHTGKPGSESVPVVVGGVMYVAAANGLFAIEPETGKQIWHHPAEQVALRGLAYWPGSGSVRARVFAGVKGGMIALDAATGKPAPGFANEGLLDLRKGVADGLPNARLSLQSPPSVFRNLVIAGSSNGEGSPTSGAYGDIRAWDASTGKLVWTFHTVPRPGEPGSETWPEGAWKQRAGTNAWGFLSVDVERGIVYVPLGSPTSDFYGADRHGNNLYGNCLVALDATTGQLKWFQQLVHHDLWDFDPAAAPALFDAVVGGKKVPAVAQITKVGLLFAFDRVTGKPLYGMEERPVPQTSVPGEKTSPTQPFPLKPPPLARLSFAYPSDLYDSTPEHAAFCRDLFEKNQMKPSPLYTPFGLEGNTLMFPSTIGGGGWGGVSVDAGLGLLFVNVSHIGQWGHMEKKVDAKTGEVTYTRTSAYGTYARFWDRDAKIPCNKPPFGEMIAIDTRTGDVAWRVPLGRMPALEARGVNGTGSPNLGGSIATAGGLVFIGATNDSRFRAFESATGRMVWEQPIDANGHTIPITYQGKDGKQYVAIHAGGGGGFFGGTPSDAIVAFALGERKVDAIAPLSRMEKTPDVGPKAPAVLVDGPGKAVVQRACGTTCHNVGVVVGTRRDKAAWTAMVDTMISRGAKANRDEARQILDYLITNFGK